MTEHTTTDNTTTDNTVTGHTMAERLYEKPVLKHLGLLRELTKFSGTLP